MQDLLDTINNMFAYADDCDESVAADGRVGLVNQPNGAQYYVYHSKRAELPAKPAASRPGALPPPSPWDDYGYEEDEEDAYTGGYYGFEARRPKKADADGGYEGGFFGVPVDDAMVPNPTPNPPAKEAVLSAYEDAAAKAPGRTSSWVREETATGPIFEHMPHVPPTSLQALHERYPEAFPSAENPRKSEKVWAPGTDEEREAAALLGDMFGYPSPPRARGGMGASKAQGGKPGDGPRRDSKMGDDAAQQHHAERRAAGLPAIPSKF